MAQKIKNLPTMQETKFDPWVRKIPWRVKWQPIPVFLSGESPRTEKPGGLESTGSQRAGHDWVTKHAQHMWVKTLYSSCKGRSPSLGPQDPVCSAHCSVSLHTGPLLPLPCHHSSFHSPRPADLTQASPAPALNGCTMLVIVMSSWWIHPFIITIYAFLSLIMLSILKFTLSSINIATLALFCSSFAWCSSFPMCLLSPYLS